MSVPPVAVRVAIRRLLRDKPTNLFLILSLASVIGVCGAVAALRGSVAAGALPVQDPERVVYVGTQPQGRSPEPLTPALLDDWRVRQRAFDAIAGYTLSELNLADDVTVATRVAAATVTTPFFQVLDIAPLLGRTFSEQDEPSGQRLVVIAETLWRTRYGADRAIVGRAIRVGGEPATIIGVMPDGFSFPNSQALWQLTPLDPLGTSPRFQIVARLTSASSLASATEDIARLLRNYEGVGQPVKDHRPYLIPIRDRLLGPGVNRILQLLTYAALALVLLASANIATFTMMRALDAKREIAMRQALGAAPRHIVGGIVLDVGLLAAIACLLGVGATTGIVSWIRGALQQAAVPPWISPGVDWRVLAWIVGAAALATVLSAMLPILRVGRWNLAQEMAQGGKGSAGKASPLLIRGVVITEVALACCLIVLAVVLGRSHGAVGSMDYGFDRSVVLGRVVFDSTAERSVSLSRLLQIVGETPGVRGVFATSSLPGWYPPQSGVNVRAANGQEAETTARTVHVTGDYLSSLGIRLLTGRLPVWNQEPDVSVVTQRFVDRYLQGRPAVGATVTVDMGTSRTTKQVVGIIADVHPVPGQDESALVYVAASDQFTGAMYLGLHSSEPLASLVPTLSARIKLADPDLPLMGVSTLDEHIARAGWMITLLATLLGGLGVVAGLLGVVGVQSVLAFAVAQRRKEIAIRLALGSTASNVIQRILGRSALEGAAGALLGLAIAVAAMAAVRPLLFGLGILDLWTGLLLAITTLAAVFAAQAIRVFRMGTSSHMSVLRET